MTPLHCASEDNDYLNEFGIRQNGKLLDYVNAILEVAAEYSTPVLDLYRNCGIQPKIQIQRELFMPDGIHPNDLGYERIADRIIAFLNGL